MSIRSREIFVFLLLTHFHHATGETQPSDANTQSEDDTKQDFCENQNVCGLWIAESSFFKNRLGIFTGVDLKEGQAVLEDRDLLVPMYDANHNEWSQWQDVSLSGHVQVDLFLQNYFEIQTFVAGLAPFLICSDELSTVSSEQNTSIWYDSLGVHRSKDPTAGSFSYRQSSPYVATTNLTAGRELFTKCAYWKKKKREHFGLADYIKQQTRKPTLMLREEGICIDNLSVRPSTIPNIGRGAFAKSRVKKGGILISSPVVPFDRSQMEIVQQEENELGRIEYSEQVEHHNLLLNYCYGHPNSTVLLLPYAPGVNYINHNHEQPNVIMEWSKSPLMDNELLELDAHSLLEKSTGSKLVVDYVALRDIEPGEEIFLDYGRAWQTAWETFVRGWNAPAGSKTYRSAVDYRTAHADENIRTEEEQKENPYPDNIITACFFRANEQDDEDYDNVLEEHDEETLNEVWLKSKHMGCLRRCAIAQRYTVQSMTFYDVWVEQAAPDECESPENQDDVTRVPASFVQLADREYTSDQQMKSSFRHEVGVKTSMYPNRWMVDDGNTEGDFTKDNLVPGQIEPIRWKKDGTVIAKNSYVMGLSPHVREVLLDYCERMGIADHFRNLTIRRNPLRPEQTEMIVLNGFNWYIQRPHRAWRSNIHWISPMDAEAHEDYLMALSAAGFDEVLDRIGKKFSLDGLVAYHITFIAVSHCSRGFMHIDMQESGSKVFNVIIPLILAEKTGPELDLRQDGSYDQADVGRFRYQYDVAALMGDDAQHGSSAVDYRVTNEMRMAATVYIADINEENVENIMAYNTQRYPPIGRPDILLQMAGTHWKKDDPLIKLPQPTESWLS